MAFGVRHSLIFFLFLWLAVPAQLIGLPTCAVPLSLLRERSISNEHAEEIEARYQTGRAGTFTSRDGHPIYFKVIPAPRHRASVVLVPGLSENTVYYKELIYTLTQEGYSVYTYDPRGQGKSGSLAVDPHVVHINKYADYVDDLDWFLTKIVRPDVSNEYTVLGNSNGGLTAIRLAQREPGLIPSLIAVSPPLRLKPTNVPQFFVSAAIRVLGYVRGWEAYAPSQKPFSTGADLDKAPYRTLRQNLNAGERAKDETIARGGASNQWTREVLREGKLALARIKYVTQPTLIITGERDSIVSTSEPAQFAQTAKAGTHLSIANGRHDLLFEKDIIRDRAMIEVLRFLVNPVRLDAPAKPNEYSKLVERALDYVERKEPAFARYAMDEAIRVYDAKRKTEPSWDTAELNEALRRQSDALWEKLEAIPPEQRALYTQLTKRRLAEIEETYKP